MKLFKFIFRWFIAHFTILKTVNNSMENFKRIQSTFLQIGSELDNVKNRCDQVENSGGETEKRIEKQIENFKFEFVTNLNVTQKIQDQYHRETTSQYAKIDSRIRKIERILTDRFGPSWNREPLLNNEETTSRDGHSELIPFEQQEFDPALLEKVVQQNRKLFGEGVVTQ